MNKLRHGFKAPKGRNALAQGATLCNEFNATTFAPFSAAFNTNEVARGITDGLILKLENTGFGKSPLTKGVAKPGDLSLTHSDIKIPVVEDGAATTGTGKSPFYSPFAKGDKETATKK